MVVALCTREAAELHGPWRADEAVDGQQTWAQ